MIYYLEYNLNNKYLLKKNMIYYLEYNLNNKYLLKKNMYL
jgi:hypothetical protein